MYSESASVLVACYDKLLLPNTEAIQHVENLQSQRNINACDSVVLHSVPFWLTSGQKAVAQSRFSLSCSSYRIVSICDDCAPRVISTKLK